MHIHSNKSSFKVREIIHFSRISLQMMKNVFINHCSMQKQWIDKDESPQPTSKSGASQKETLCCVYDGIPVNFEFLNCSQTLNANLFSLKLQCVHEYLRKCLPIVNRRNGMPSSKTRPHSTRMTQGEKHWIYVGLTLSDFFFVPYKIFLMTIFSKIRWKHLWKTTWAWNKLNFT